VRLHDDGGAILVSGSATPFDAWMHRMGIMPYEVTANDGSGAAQSFRSEFPTIAIFRALASGEQRGRARPARRTDSAILTPLGETIAKLVLEESLGVRFTHVLMMKGVTPNDGK
jgi:hypothetical protein